MAELAGFREFVMDRSPMLLRTAWLLTGDWHLAEDLVQAALLKTSARWSKIRRTDAPEVFVRRVMVTTFLSWRTRRWIGEVPTEVVPERADESGDTDLRVALLAVVRQLPRRQRAVVALRYFADLTEAQTAQALGCSVGTVKSHTARALSRLREVPALADLFSEEIV